MATDFFTNTKFIQIFRPTTTIIRLIHTLKTYYYIVEPKQILNQNKIYDNYVEQQLDRTSIVHIRGYILNLINKLMFTLPNGCSDEKDLNRDDEFQSIFNYISTVNEV